MKLPRPRITPIVPMPDLGWIKLESQQISGTVKYRMVYQKLKKAFEQGEIWPGMTLTEVTAGSTGKALAYAGKRLGLNVKLHAWVGQEDQLKAARRHGAHVHWWDSSTPFSEILDHLQEGHQEKTHWHLNQYDGTSASDAYQNLAQEVVTQLKNLDPGVRPNTFVCPVGTGGVIQSVGAQLRQEYEDFKVVSVEPHPDTSIEGIRNTNCLHLGHQDPYNIDFPDERIETSKPDPRQRMVPWKLASSAQASMQVARRRGWKKVFILAAS